MGKMEEMVKEMEYREKIRDKENDDLKYDNTLLYEKNVEKDEKIIVL